MPAVPTNLDDDDLAALARGEGLGAELCARIVTRHGGMVMAACRRILGDRGDAEDAMQETFILLVRKAGRLPQGTSLAGWLYHAACRTALNHQRSAMRRHVRESSPEAAANTLPAESAEEWAVLEPQLDEAMLTLPARQRDLVVQCYFENQPQRAAARSLGVSESVASRELGAAMEALRRFFAKRGAAPTCAALVTLLGANAAKAAKAANAAASPAPAAVAGAMLKAAGTLAPQAGTLLLLPVLSMKLKLILASALLLAGAAVYDIGSDDSHLRRFAGEGWQAGERDSKVAGAAVPHAVAAADRRERLLAEGKGIWEKAAKIERPIFDQLLSLAARGFDRDKLLQALRAGGVMISEAAFDRLLAAQKAGNHSPGEVFDFFQQMLKAWIDEAPREATAWAYAMALAGGDKELVGINTALPLGISAARRDLAAWEAFLETAPDRRIALFAKAWMLEADQPGSIWTHGKEAGISSDAMQTYVRELIRNGAPQTALQALMSSPDGGFKNRGIIGLAAKLSATELAVLAGGDFAGEGAVANFLLAAAGAPGADYAAGADFALSSRKAEPYDNQYAEWAMTSAGRLYEQWLKNDPASALGQVAAAGSQEYLEMFMERAAGGGLLDEPRLLQALGSAESRQRDKALAALYRAQAGGDPLQTLQRITRSESIADQVNAAKPVLGAWAQRFPEEAAAWMKGLAAGPDRLELAAIIAGEWVDTAPEAATAFAQEQGLGLAHGFAAPLAFAIRTEAEASLSRLLQPYQAEPQYNRLVAMIAGYRLPNNPQGAFAFLERHGSSGWQSVMVDETLRFLKSGDSRWDDYAGALTGLNLAGVKAERLASVAGLYAKKMEDQGGLRQVLDWTLKLPPEAAPQARAEIIAGSQVSEPAKRQMISNWIQTSLVNAEERARLMEVVGQARP